MMQGYDQPVVFFNALFDTKFLKRDGLSFPQHLVHDALPMCWLKSPIGPTRLKSAATKYVDRRAAVGQGLLEEVLAKNNWDWKTVPTDCVAWWSYGVLDTCLTALLAEKLWPEIKASYHYAYELELAVIHCLRDAELAGLLVDEDARLRTEAKLRQELDQLRAFEIPSELEKPTSDQQVIKYLRGIGAGKHLIFRTDKNNTSVDKHALAYVAKQGYEVAAKIAAFRSRTTTLNNYVMKFADSYLGGLAQDNVLHCNTHPIQARTGRMSITEPPLQTLPRGRVVRDCIIARPGTRFVKADFEGVEMRVMASLSQDEGLLAAFERGEDPHGFVAESVYGPGWTKQQRSTAKNAGFALIYGAGIPQFSATAGIPLDEGEAFMAKHRQLFPAVHTFMQTMIDSVYETAGRGKWGYVELQDGRRLPVEKDKAYAATNYCLAPGVRVLKADYTWQPIEDLVAGDSLVGFDENAPYLGRRTGGQGARLRDSVVEGTSLVSLPSYRITTTEGEIICSNDHRWLLAGKHRNFISGYNSNRRWSRADDIQIGDSICFFAQPWEFEDTWQSGYIAGMFDAEGCFSSLKGRPGKFQFSQNPGVVYEKMYSLLTERGYDVADYRKPSGTSPCWSLSLAGIPQVMRALGQHPIARLRKTAEGFWQGRQIDGRWPVAHVLAVEEIGNRELVSVQTSTRTFIADGYLSHNCIQGGCAVTLKERIVAMDNAGMGDFFRLPVHDECLYEVPHEHVREARHIVDTTMPDHSWPGLTLTIDRDEVSRWGNSYAGDYPAYIETELADWEVELAGVVG